MAYDHNRIKENARLFYKNNTGNSIVSQLIYYGVGIGVIFVVYILMFVIVGASAFSIAIAGGSESEGAVTGAAVGTLISMLIFFVLYIAILLGINPLVMGLMDWYRKSIYEKTPLGEIFAPYKKEHVMSNIGTMLLMQLYTFLWSLLFVIPGIIKSYSYCQTTFIKAENPNISPSRAIELSKIMMEGHKADLFYLHLSFIGWILLSGLTYNILGIVYVYPYYFSALSFAYVEVKADAIAKGLINASEFNPIQENYFGE
ncbi:MAG: DUF975 family protein [Oscillospiraceae bacterium]|nr:DUF975 family protein [Oscillospiraceae bacterium]